MKRDELPSGAVLCAVCYVMCNELSTKDIMTDKDSDNKHINKIINK